MGGRSTVVRHKSIVGYGWPNWNVEKTEKIALKGGEEHRRFVRTEI